MPLTAPRRQSLRDPLRPVATDLLRLAAALSVVLGTLGWGFIGFALFMLVLGGSMIPRALGTPAPLDLSFCATILVGAWAAMLDWYLAVSWLDVVVHAALTGLVGAIGYAALERLRLFGEGMTRLGVVVVSSTLATTLALLWEMGEWFGHTVLDDRIQVGYEDTLGDLAAGVVGAVVAAVLLALSRPEPEGSG